MIRRSARILDVPIDDSGAMEIARRARVTPRVAYRLLRRARDYAQVRVQGMISAPIADEALTLLEVDPGGLDKMDRAILLAILDRFSGGPVSIETLAAALGEDPTLLSTRTSPSCFNRVTSASRRGAVWRRNWHFHISAAPGVANQRTAGYSTDNASTGGAGVRGRRGTSRASGLSPPSPCCPRAEVVLRSFA